MLTALLLAATAPRLEWSVLAPVALVPMLIGSARESSPKRRFLQGWAAGFVYWFIVCTWIQYVLEVHGGMGFWGGWGSFLLFCALKAIHLGVFSWLAWYALRAPLPSFAVAALWTGIERTHGTFGFAWFTLGNAGIDWPWLLGIAQVFGVYGLSFLFAFTAAKFAHGLAASEWRPILLTLILLMAPLRPSSSAPDREAVFLQPMIGDDVSWTRENIEAMVEDFSGYSIAAVRGVATREPAAAPRLIVWPEMPGPFYYFRDARFRAAAAAVSQNTAAYFLFTTVDFAPDGAPLNSAVLLNPKGEFVERYEKMNLVPFGEFVPPLFGFVNRITQEAGDFVPGTRQINFPLPDAPLGAFICYESAFPDFVRKFSRNGAAVFANLSNDGYFGDSKAREQHLSLVRMRAVENRRWILRVTNSGISAAIDPAGRVTQRLPEKERLARALRYGLVREITWYARWGDWFAWTCLFAALFAAGVTRVWRMQQEAWRPSRIGPRPQLRG